MRRFREIALIGLVACSARPVSQRPAAATPLPLAEAAPAKGVKTPPDESRLTQSNGVSRSERPTGPVVTIDAQRIIIDGTVVGNVRSIDDSKRPQRVDDLFDILMQRRASWIAQHPNEAIPELASLQVAPGTSGLVLFSVHRTMAFAGFPQIQIAATDDYVETWAAIPGPRGTPVDAPCPFGPLWPALHVQADEDAWRLRIPRAKSPLEASGEQLHSSVESFRGAVTELTAHTNISAVVFHVAPSVSFARLAPFLVEAAKLSRRAGQIHGVLLEWRAFDFDTAAELATLPYANCASADSEGTTGTDGGAAPAGALAPAAIQKVVRAHFVEKQQCYEPALTRNPNAQGTTRTRLVIGTDGKVREARTTASGSLPQEMTSCLTAVFRSLTFEPSSRAVTVSYPLTFSPG